MNKERVKQLATTLMALCLAFSTCIFASPQRAQGAEQVAYWHLADIEVFDTNPYGYIGDVQIDADSGGNYCDTAQSWSDESSPVPDRVKDSYTQQYMTWTSSTAWTMPPETIQLGKEDEFTLTLQQSVGNIQYRLGESGKKAFWDIPTLLSRAELSFSVGFLMPDASPDPTVSTHAPHDAYNAANRHWAGYMPLGSVNDWYGTQYHYRPVEEECYENGSWQGHYETGGETGFMEILLESGDFAGKSQTCTMSLYGAPKQLSDAEKEDYRHKLGLDLSAQIGAGTYDIRDLYDYGNPTRLGMCIYVECSTDGKGFAYYYEYDAGEGATFVSDTTASSTPGEEEGIPVPAAILGGAVVVGGGAALILKKRKSSPKPSSPSPRNAGTPPEGSSPEKEREQEEEKSSTFQMIVFKNFGDTLFVGAKPQMVGARIEEVTAEGLHHDRPDLTAGISIEGSDAIKVVPSGMQGRYASAQVEGLAPEGKERCDGIITFTFTSASGRLINNVSFHVVDQRKIVFAQENLTFIAGQGQSLAMPFGIVGAGLDEGASPPMEVSITSSRSEDFKDIHIEKDEKHPLLWNVVMTECSKPDSLPAGSMASLSCQVSATVPGAQGSQTITGSYDFFLFFEGIRFSIQHLKAYYVLKEDPATTALPYEFTELEQASTAALASAGGMAGALGAAPSIHKLVKASKPVKHIITPALTKAQLTFYTWDEEKGAIINPVPKLGLEGQDPQGAVRFSFTDVPGSSLLKNEQGKDVEKPCETLEFTSFITDIVGETNTLCYSILPTKGVLLPPNRSQAEVEVSFEWAGRSFSAKETVNVISQPYREDLDERMEAYVALDQQRLERLLYIQRKIITSKTTYEKPQDHFSVLDTIEEAANIVASIGGAQRVRRPTVIARNTYRDLMPVYHRIDVMLEGYALEFGYYEPDYQRVNDLFIRYTNGKLGDTEAADIAFYGRCQEESDAMLMTISDFNHSWTLIGARIGAALVTAGSSEAVFLPTQAIAKGVEASFRAIDSGKGDSLLEIYRIGCSEASKQALIDYLMGKSIELGIYAASAAGKAAGKAAKALGSKAKEAKNALIQKLAKYYSTGKAGARIKGAADALGKEMDDAARTARDLIQRHRGLVLSSKELTERDIAYTLGRIEGKIKCLDFIKSLKNWNKLTRFQQRQLAMAIQKDKHAMRTLMAADDPVANTVRAQFSKVIGEIQEQSLHQARVAIASERGVPLNRIRVKKTSGNSMADIAAGKKISMDMDATFEIEVDGAWYDVKESVGQEYFNRSVYKIVHGQEAADDIAAAFAKEADFSIVDAAGKESYGTYDDALRVIEKSRAGEVFDDAQRVGETAEYKCEEWLRLAKHARADAEVCRRARDIAMAQKLAAAAESFTEEGCRSFGKQFERIIRTKLAVLKEHGVNVDMDDFIQAAEVIKQSGIEKSGGLGCTSPEVEVVLENGLNTSLGKVFHQINYWTVKLNDLVEKAMRS